MLIKTKKALNNNMDYYLAPKIESMLKKAKKQVLESDWDRVYIIDGQEGSGKSLLALQIGHFLDKTLSLDRVTYTGEEFSKAIQDAKKHQCIIFDEAFNGLSSSGATSKLNKLIVGKLMECRQKNLFVIIVLPTIFLLQKYASIFRSKALFHVYVTRKGVRGYYRVYNYKNKKILFLSGQKLYSYSMPRLNESFRFYGKYPIDEAEYRKKKLESIRTAKKVNPQEEALEKERDMAIYILNKSGLSHVKISERFKELNTPLSSSKVGYIISKITVESVKPPQPLNQI